jgi:hypothetical protein
MIFFEIYAGSGKCMYPGSGIQKIRRQNRDPC